MSLRSHSRFGRRFNDFGAVARVAALARVSSPLGAWAEFGHFMGSAERDAPEVDKLSEVDDDIHVIVVGNRSWKLRRCLNFSVQCCRPANRWTTCTNFG